MHGAMTVGSPHPLDWRRISTKQFSHTTGLIARTEGLATTAGLSRTVDPGIAKVIPRLGGDARAPTHTFP